MFLSNDNNGYCEKLTTNLLTTIIFVCFNILLSVQIFKDKLACSSSDDKLKYASGNCYWDDLYNRTNINIDNVKSNVSINTISSINLYKWSPIILIFQYLSFLLPNFLWRLFCLINRKNIHKVIKTTKNFTYSNNMDVNFKIFENISSKILCKSNGILLNFYGVVKFTNLLITIFNLFINEYLFRSYDMFNESNNSYFFPQVIYCKSIECVHKTYFLIASIFLLLKLILIILVLIVLIDFIYWLINYYKWPNNFIDNYLNNSTNNDIQQFKLFYLNKDTELLLKLIEENSGYFITSEVIWKFWDYFNGKFPEAQADAPPLELFDRNEIIDGKE